MTKASKLTREQLCCRNILVKGYDTILIHLFSSNVLNILLLRPNLRVSLQTPKTKSLYTPDSRPNNRSDTEAQDTQMLPNPQKERIVPVLPGASSLLGKVYPLIYPR